MSDIEITNIQSQDKIRGEFFSFTKLITVNKNLDSSPNGNITTITGLSQEVHSPFLSYAGTPVSTGDTITITLELDGTPVTYPHNVDGNGEYRIRLAGQYDGVFTDDVVKHVPAGKSAMLKDAVYGDDPSTTEVVETDFEIEAERELTTEEFNAAQQNFPEIVPPTIGNNITNLPDNVELFHAIQDLQQKLTLYIQYILV